MVEWFMFCLQTRNDSQGASSRRAQHAFFFLFGTRHYGSDVLAFFLYVCSFKIPCLILKISNRVSVGETYYKLTVLLRYALAFFIHGLALK